MQANCQAPTYATDLLVCSDLELKTLDAEMGALLSRLDATAIDGVPPMLESQYDWFKRRSLCAFDEDHRQCTDDAYTERLVVLLTMLQPEPSDLASFSCQIDDGFSKFRAIVVADRALAILDGDDIVGVALEGEGKSTWRPFLELRGSIEHPIAMTASELEVGCHQAR